MDIKNYYLYSGGAEGYDHFWGEVAIKFGMPPENIRHFWHGTKTPHGNAQLSDEQIEEGWQIVLLANKTLKRRPEKYKSLLARNWWQVREGDAIYAVSELVPNSNREVKGGTGWAVQMAFDAGKQLYVFDHIQEKWFSSYGGLLHPYIGVPPLTEHFAGIGSRFTNDVGKRAIVNLFTQNFR